MRPPGIVCGYLADRYSKRAVILVRRAQKFLSVCVIAVRGLEVSPFVSRTEAVLVRSPTSVVQKDKLRRITASFCEIREYDILGPVDSQLRYGLHLSNYCDIGRNSDVAGP